MALYWIKARKNESCENTCKNGASGTPTNMKPVKCGKWKGNQEPFKVCGAGEGPRPGYQLDGFNPETCRVPQGDKEKTFDSYYCLCTDEDVKFID